MSDHKLIKVSRYAKTLRNMSAKGVSNILIKKKMIRNVREMPELISIAKSNCPNHAAKLLSADLSRVLHDCAPIRTIQNRSNYAW